MLGDNLKRIRKEHGFTQEELAVRLHVVRQTVSKWEKNLSVPDAELLQPGLNSLYALSRGLCEPRLIKAAFELRLMCLGGYAPDLSSCAACGEEPGDPVFHPSEGRIYCRACPHGGGVLSLSGEALAALRYLASAPAKKLFSFSIGEEALGALGRVTESYLLRQSERRFGTLDYYKQIRIG